MLVVATKTGYYKRRIREPGDTFEYPIKPGEVKEGKMPTWMKEAPKQAKAEAADSDEEDENPLD